MIQPTAAADVPTKIFNMKPPLKISKIGADDLITKLALLILKKNLVPRFALISVKAIAFPSQAAPLTGAFILLLII